MCGRYTLTNPTKLADNFNVEIPDDLPPRYNIAPTQSIAAITNADPRRLTFLKWGLIPSWAQDQKIGNSLINARAETVAAKPAFRSALQRRRCLILADGFYEWRKEGESKTPLHIFLKNHQPFAFAGLWEVWRDPEGQPVESCTIITTEPNALMSTIHNRMPVILPREEYPRWLAAGALDGDEATCLLRPYPADEMDAYAVSRAVNAPRNEGPELLRKAEGLFGS